MISSTLDARFHKERKYKRIKVSTLGRLIQLPEEDREPKVLLLDLRSPEEFEECHILDGSLLPVLLTVFLFFLVHDVVFPDIQLSRCLVHFICVVFSHYFPSYTLRNERECLFR
jgi:hypothetical protein